jgi:hypothetical protein
MAAFDSGEEKDKGKKPLFMYFGRMYSVFL